MTSETRTSGSARGAWIALLLLLLINLMNYVDRQILSAVEHPIAQEFGVTATDTGWLATAFLLSYMVFAPLFGVLADRMSRWVIVGGGVVLWSLASGGSGAVHTYTLLLVMRLLIGIGEAAYGPVAPTIISDLYPIESRGRVLAWFYAAIPVGSALGYVVGGLFHSNWHLAFYLTLPPGILLGAGCFFMRDPAVQTRKQVTRRASADDYKQLLRNKSYVLDCAGMTAMTFALGGIAFYMPRWLELRGLAPEKATPIFGGIVVLSGLLGTLIGGVVGDRLRKRFSGSYFLVSGVAMLIGFPLFLAMLKAPFPLCWVLIFLTCFCLFFNTGPSNTVIANVTHPTVRATAFAANIFIIHAFGDAISPPLIGWFADRWGLDVAFMVMSLTIVLGGVLWLWGARYLAQDTAAVEQALAADPAANGEAPSAELTGAV
ncbi:MAG: spinster family MFS transporter [Tepidisphaeraceae bacterium]